MDNNKWRENRYKLFNEKIDYFREHKAYNEWLRKYADDAILWNEMTGFLQIKATDFIKRIEKMPVDYIRGWLDGENNLDWKPEFQTITT